jgi:ABC-2 type transport system permease protein
MNALAPLMNSPMGTLIRREFWEHRALWITPLVVAGLLLFGVIAGAAVGSGELNFDVGPNLPTAQTVLAIAILSFTVPQFLVMLVMLFFYLLDCLYTERKDRSILFWKSMPVSDTSTVLSKVLVALVIVPIGVFLLTAVTDIVVAAVVAASVNGGGDFWDTATWLKFRAAMVPGLAIVLLWYLPIAGYLLLVSAWARRNVFLWAALPPFLAMVIENRAFGTHYLATFLQYRISGVWKFFGTGQSLSVWHDGMPPIGPLVESVGATRALADVDLWLGIAAAALLIFGAIRIRRYRDDT